MYFVILVLSLIFIIFLIEQFKFNRTKIKTGRRLPGPLGLPLIGNLHQIGSKPHLQFIKWKETYGNIFTVKFGSQRAVVIDDVKMIKEAFNDNSFSGRPQNHVFTISSNGNYGVANSEGEIWETIRRFTIRHLRDFGFGKNYMENLILDEVAEILQWLKENENRPISINRKFNLAVLNSLWTITSGQRSSQDDQKLTSLIEDFMSAFNKTASYGITFSSLMRHVAPNTSGWNALLKASENLSIYLKTTADEHINRFEEGNISDFLDNIISEIKRCGDSTSGFYGDVGYANMLAISSDIFLAGSSTTSTTLTWAILYLTKFKNVQEKMQQEIDFVIGQSKLPSLDDRPRMPYTESVIKETLRKSSHLPLGVFHRAMESKEFHGYMIPKGTWLLGNFYSVHHSTQIWGEDAQEFNPDRFMSSDKTLNNSLMAFSTGKRQCLGEQLAKDTIFLFLTSIFQKFNISKEHSEMELGLEPELGFTMVPKDFKIVVEQREF